jgi:hypothetical protein
MRNTFDPQQKMMERLGIRQTILQTSRADAGEKNLEDALANGRPALVWADVFSLPYNGLPADEKNWDMQPLVVYGLENGMAYLADRSGQPLKIPAGVLTAARARVKKDRFRVVTLDPPDESKLLAAVQQGIWQCIQLYTEKPPRGTVDNFGFAAFQKWASMLANTRNPQSWERLFPAGQRMFAALAGNAYLPGVYGWIVNWGTRPDADRSTYADFLDEAAILLKKSGLSDAGERFRESGKLWKNLADALLPADVPLLGEARRLKDRRHRLFQEEGGAAEPEIREINSRLGTLREDSRESFPFSPETAADFRAQLKEHVLSIHDKEKEAIEALRSAISNG